jgi:outer membrane immunogenic protein
MRQLGAIGLTGIGVIGFCITTAAAADMPLKAPRTVAAVVANWTGFYAGINLGGGQHTASGAAGDRDPASDALLVQFPIDTTARKTGILGGVQVGYNRQWTSQVVIGIEADIQGAALRAESSRLLEPGGFPLRFDTNSSIDWFGTVRARMGVLATPGLLLYGTGGLAYGHVNNTAAIVIVPPPLGSASIAINIDGLQFNCSANSVTGPQDCYSGSQSRVAFGWTAGAGLEYRLAGNLSAKLEYLHVDLGRRTVRMDSPSPPSDPGVFIDYRVRNTMDIVRVGLNYRFDSPVVARY